MTQRNPDEEAADPKVITVRRSGRGTDADRRGGRELQIEVPVFDGRGYPMHQRGVTIDLRVR
jgi:hypothetical protein